MSDPKEASSNASAAPPAGSRTHHDLVLPDGTRLDYEAVADWVVLREKEDPSAEVFHVAYLLEGSDRSTRPITFVFNGGPGAASAYLHMGAVGPRRVRFNADGTSPPPPVRVIDNAETWLRFTDLVFIDPVGTGFSRAIKPSGGDDKDKGGKKPGVEPHEKAFYALNKDLDSLCEFAQRFLSAHGRWESPIFIAGESYGGFRGAQLARRMQEGYGVGLNGVILISPALEWGALNASDYDVLRWVDGFPSMVAAAVAHGRSRALARDTPTAQVLEVAERFALRSLAPLLVGGELLPAEERARIIEEEAALLGLPTALVAVNGGRISIVTFARELLRDERRVLGLYDAVMSSHDPFPDRDPPAGPDASLVSIERLFTAGTNAHLRGTLGLQTDRTYHLLNMDVNRSWSVDAERHVFESPVGATDDLRYALALNPHLHVFITHGLYDLVTPYFAANRITAHMKLDASCEGRLHLQHFPGGHMFYTWEASRRAFRDAIAAFIHTASRQDAG